MSLHCVLINGVDLYPNKGDHERLIELALKLKKIDKKLMHLFYQENTDSGIPDCFHGCFGNMTVNKKNNLVFSFFVTGGGGGGGGRGGGAGGLFPNILGRRAEAPFVLLLQHRFLNILPYGGLIFMESPKRPSKLIFVVLNFVIATSLGAWH